VRVTVWLSSVMPFCGVLMMPETSSAYHLAYTIALAIYTVYGVSLYVRRKGLRARGK
jgi:hypothetical protein